MGKDDIISRFFHEKRSFLREEIEERTQIDYIKNLSIVAVVGEFGFGKVIGVGKYFLIPQKNIAEIAFTVSKAYFLVLRSTLLEVLPKKVFARMPFPCVPSTITSQSNSSAFLRMTSGAKPSQTSMDFTFSAPPGSSLSSFSQDNFTLFFMRSIVSDTFSPFTFTICKIFRQVQAMGRACRFARNIYLIMIINRYGILAHRFTDGTSIAFMKDETHKKSPLTRFTCCLEKKG